MSQRRTPDRKRKRVSSVASTPPRLLPEESINPLSHPPSTLKQFATAGLAEKEPLPSELIPGFPHKPLPRTAAPGEEDTDEETGEEGLSGTDAETVATEADEAEASRLRIEKRERGLANEARLHEREVGVVAAIMRRCLEEGDIPRAKLAFGRLVRSIVHGKKVDLRYGGYWAMGAEILMRDGEVRSRAGATEEDEQDEQRDPRAAPKRWGLAANIVKVRTFFEDLIQLHPYDRHHPGSISALDFWPVMLSCEMYNVYIEHKLAVERLDAGEDDEIGGMDLDEEPSKLFPDYDEKVGEDSGPLGNMQSEALREARNTLRLQALEGMRDIASRMDAIMENAPYTTSLEMLRLRGMAALYMGDLALPSHPRTVDEDRDGRARRTEETDRAKTAFRKFAERGGEVEVWFRHLVRNEEADDDDEGEEEVDEEEEEGSGGLLPMYSSLPIRE